MNAAKESGKKKLCNALVSLLGRKKLDEILIKDLCAEAGVNRSTYNYHFYDIRDVFDAVLDDFNEGMINYFNFLAKEVEPDKSLEFNVARECFQYILDNKRLVMTIDRAGYSLPFINKFINSMEDFFHRYELSFKDDNGKEFTVSGGLVYELVIKEYCFTVAADLQLWMEYNFLLPVEEIIDSALYIKRIHLTKMKK